MQGGVFMAAKSSRTHSPKQKKPGGKRRTNPALVLLYSFGCGTGAAMILLVIMAQIFSHTALSLDLVRPFASAAAAVGALISGYLLANGLQQKRLFCGAASGGFFCLCLLCATLIQGLTPAIDQSSATMLASLLLGGTIGGGLSALGAPSGVSRH